MIDRTMTEDDLAEQAKRYGHNYFRTCRQAPIRINDGLSLRDALDALTAADDRRAAAHRNECMVTGAEKYKSAQEETRSADENYDDAKAQAMAAFWRETGRWPYEAYRIGLR